jgi:6-pyruvoyltetrahydropterin/6-carboxytetrahydropterin synthase
MYFALWVDLSSQLDPDTGFVVNVSEIDKMVRSKVIPVFEQTIQSFYNCKKSPLLWDMVCLLRRCRGIIQGEFTGIELARLRLELNPFRQLIIHAENDGMFIFSEKFEFAAMHRLWNDKFDEKTNYEKFGKCANQAGHGHNYILEVQVQGGIEEVSNGWLHDYQKVVKEDLLDLMDHKNLNTDVPGLDKLNPTVENLARFAWEKLAEKFNHCKLFRIKIWENDRTYCVYSEQ